MTLPEFFNIRTKGAVPDPAVLVCQYIWLLASHAADSIRRCKHVYVKCDVMQISLSQAWCHLLMKGSHAQLHSARQYSCSQISRIAPDRIAGEITLSRYILPGQWLQYTCAMDNSQQLCVSQLQLCVVALAYSADSDKARQVVGRLSNLSMLQRHFKLEFVGP